MSSEGTSKLKPYAAPVLTVHGEVTEVTQAVGGAGGLDGKTKGNKDFRTQ